MTMKILKAIEAVTNFMMTFYNLLCFTTNNKGCYDNIRVWQLIGAVVKPLSLKAIRVFSTFWIKAYRLVNIELISDMDFIIHHSTHNPKYFSGKHLVFCLIFSGDSFTFIEVRHKTLPFLLCKKNRLFFN